MSNFLRAQLDYIFFFYGLAFVGLGVVSYLLSRDVKQRPPWGWLALFGFSHGLNEWLDLVALSWPDEFWFSACRWILMAGSFLCLVQFGRLSLIRRRGQGPGLWVLGILGLIAGLGALSGWNGLNATTRYALGLVGSLWAGWGLYAEGRVADLRCRPWLLGGGILLMLYGLATGIVVPPTGFFPAVVINYETFTSLTGLPIQLVRGLLALSLAAMAVGYFQASWPASHESCYEYRARYMYVVFASFALILVTGWLFTQFLGDKARREVVKDTGGHGKLIIQRLSFELEEAEAAVKSMSGSPWIGSALWSRSSQTLAQANSVIDRYQKRFGASPAYILDRTGNCIASSNRAAPDSFVGHNYAFRPYFQEAMAGQPGRYFALGVTSKKRGFFAAYPVHDQAGNIVGAAAIKLTLDEFQRELRESDPAFLVDPNGVIFLGSRPGLDHHRLWTGELSDKEKENLQASYGIANFESVFPRPQEIGATVKIAGKSYLFHRQEIKALGTPGWSLVLLVPLNQIVLYRLVGIAAAFIIAVLTLVFAGTNLSIREGANRILTSEARFRAMWEAAPEAVFVYDPDTRKILDANPFMSQWLGYDQEEILGLDIEAVLAPGSLGPEADCLPAGAEGQFHSPGPRYRKKDGTLVDVECTAAKILHGDYLRDVVFVRDITARRQWEETVQTTNGKLQALVTQVEERNRIMSMANEMADMLHSCQTSKEAYEAIGHFMPRFFPDDAGTLYMLNSSRNLFEVVARWGQAPPAAPDFAPDECWSVRRGRLHQVEDLQEGLLCRHASRSLAHGYVCAPLIAQGETLGVFHMQFGTRAAEQASSLAVAREQLALTVTEHMALALANLKLRETLRRQAIRDPLTGLFNRRYLEETMGRELHRVRRERATLGVIMMDLDHFKLYNDTFGHSAGDELLKALGILLKSRCRGEDIACRYGGEEFLLIMPGGSREAALERAEELRQAVKKMHLEHQSLKPITLSLGVAVYPDHGKISPELIKAADAALYRAKQAGRDQARLADHGGEIKAA